MQELSRLTAPHKAANQISPAMHGTLPGAPYSSLWLQKFIWYICKTQNRFWTQQMSQI